MSVMVYSSRFAPRMPGHRRGTVLIVTLWIIMVLTGLVLVLGRSMRVEAMASANRLAAIQAAAVERGAEQYVLAMLDQNGDQVMTLTDDYWADVPVGNGRFWIIRPNYGDPQMPSYGLVDEASKLNLNTASRDALSMLPGMPMDLPASIIDWRDEDSDISDGGAESEYYLSLPRPYNCKNGPLETVEELLLVKDATLQLLYGQASDGSPNLASPWTTDVSLNMPLGMDPTLVHGLYDYVTVYSVEDNNDASGQARININNDAQALSNALQNSLGASRAGAIMQARADALRSRGRNASFRDIFDFYLATNMTLQEFESVADRLTTGSQRTLTGRINVNTAPREVLLCLPGLSDSDVSAMISRRADSNLDHTSCAWVADVLGANAVGLGNRVTGRSMQYSADIVAVSGNGRAFKRCRIVVDTRSTPARIIYRKDLTTYGWPMAPEILSSLRAGTYAPAGHFSVSGGAF